MPPIKIPDGESIEVLRACRMIRAYWQLYLIRFHDMRSSSNEPQIPRMYDIPNDGTESVWYKIYKQLERKVNPLWAVNYVISSAMLAGVPPNVYSVMSEVNIEATRQHGKALASEVAISALNSIRSLAIYLPANRAAFNVTDEVAVNMLSEEAALDPVVELFWRDRKQIAASSTLLIIARLNYACHPGVYAHPSYREDWQHRRGLKKIFDTGSNDDERHIESPAIDGLSVD